MKKITHYFQMPVSGKTLKYLEKLYKNGSFIKTSGWKVNIYILLYFYNYQLKNDSNKIFISQSWRI